MLRSLAVGLIGMGIAMLVFPASVPLLPRFDYGGDFARAAGATAMMLGVFLWWPTGE